MRGVAIFLGMVLSIVPWQGLSAMANEPSPQVDLLFEDGTEDLLAFDLKDHLPRFMRSQESGTSMGSELVFVEASNRSSSAATLTWLSATPCQGFVDYGPTPDLGTQVEEASARYVHQVWLRDLSPDQEVFFKVYSGGTVSELLKFRTTAVAAGVPRVVYGALPPLGQSPEAGDVVVRLTLSGRGDRSLPLTTRLPGDALWFMNLGNLKSQSGEAYGYDDDATAEILVQGLGDNGTAEILTSYKIRLADAPEGDLTPEGVSTSQVRGALRSGAASPVQLLPAPYPRQSSSERRGPERERKFLESLLAKGAQARLQSRKGHDGPHVIPGWRGGKTMVSPSVPPKPSAPPPRLQLRGDIVLKEVLRLREERTDAREFFPDVGRHFPGLSERFARDRAAVALDRGINIFALPVEPFATVTSYGLLQDTPEATEITAWDGELQQFGASAFRVGGEIQGTDFPLVLGYGYFVSMSDPAQVHIDGDPVLHTEYVSISPGLDVVTLVGSPDSLTSHTVFAELLPNGDEICRLDAATQTYDCAIQTGGGVVIGTEFPLTEGEGYFIRSDNSGSFPEDHRSPSLSVVFPADSTEIHTPYPFIDIIFGDHGMGLDLQSFECWVNGEDRTTEFTVDDLGASWQMIDPYALPEGENLIDVLIVDVMGNQREILSSFDVVTIPPPDEEHFVNGYVYHGDTWDPMQHVGITVAGIPGVIYTDAEGHYVFPTPGLGEYVLEFAMPGYTYAQRTLSIQDGHGDVFIDDAYLSPKDSVATRITELGGLAVNSDGSVYSSFPSEVAPEDMDVSAFNLDDPEDLPSQLPELSVFTYCAKFWPDAVEFNADAFVDQLNSRGLESGTPIPVGHYDPELQSWIDEGMAYVGSDGTWFDFSVEHFLSYIDCNLPVQPRPSPDNSGDCNSRPPCPPGADCCDENHGSPSLGNVKLKSGGTGLIHSLPPVRSLGQDKALRFVYQSHTVMPQIVMQTGTHGTPEGFTLPLYTGVQVDIMGRRFTGFIQSSHDTTRQRIRVSALTFGDDPLPTGLYRHQTFLANYFIAEYAVGECFGCPPGDGTGVYTSFPQGFNTESHDNIIIEDHRASCLGAGWTIPGIQRLYFRPDGDILIIGAEDSPAFFDKVSGGPVLDLAVTKAGDDNVGIWFGKDDASGEFTFDANYSVGGGPDGVIAVDLDNDEILDLVVVDRADNNVTALLGHEDGSFSIMPSRTVGQYPTHLVSGDFDRDGYMDVAVNNTQSGNISVLLGDGMGYWKSRVNYTMHGDPASVAVGDFDEDGFWDLATPTNGTASDIISIRFGDGDGGFSERLDCCSAYNPGGVVTVDCNQDAHRDLVVSKGNGRYSQMLWMT